jgi:hypothetical protein
MANKLVDASQAYLTETYLHKWAGTVSQHMEISFSWGTAYDPFRRMKLFCKKCHQTLTCDIPETPEHLDWALQKFVGLHRHDPIAEPKPIIKVALQPIPLTADFKPVKVVREGRRFREAN